MNRIKELETLITKYQTSYYNGEAEISDSEFDLLWDELKSRSPESPVLKKIGADNTDGFPKVKHLIPMGSQDKAANPKEFMEWAKKLTPHSPIPSPQSLFIVQYKLDGASLELQYGKGILTKAVTRGDGLVGDEITANARKMSGVMQKLDIPFTGGVRGEVVMTRAVHKSKYADKANCRNAANGLMRRKDGEGCEDLTVIVYDASSTEDDAYFKDEAQKIEWLKKRGFDTTETKVFSTAQEVIDYRDQVAANRDKLPFDIDGLVVKDLHTDMADLRKARPEKQIAFKFDLETAYSILRQVEWSESGATYTPIGIIDPVRLAGTTVKRANLNNPDMIRSMGLKIGSCVAVVKRGEIIPKIEGLAPLQEKREKRKEKKEEEMREIEFPKICGVCNTKLVDAGTRLYCPNTQCPKRLLHRLEKWVSVLEIRELGDKLLRQLFDSGRVRNISDLYSLNNEELAQYERMAEISAAKVIRHIQTKRELSLQSFIAALDLEGVGELIMERAVSAGFDTLEKLKSAQPGDLSTIWGIGEITAQTITQGIAELDTEIKAILDKGIISIAKPLSAQEQPLRGNSFCFTGELKTLKRTAAEEKVKALGGQVKSSVVKDLSYLVTNDTTSGSSKNKKAASLGVPIINEEQFLALISVGTEKGQLGLF